MSFFTVQRSREGNPCFIDINHAMAVSDMLFKQSSSLIRSRPLLNIYMLGVFNYLVYETCIGALNAHLQHINVCMQPLLPYVAAHLLHGVLSTESILYENRMLGCNV